MGVAGETPAGWQTLFDPADGRIPANWRTWSFKKTDFTLLSINNGTALRIANEGSPAFALSPKTTWDAPGGFTLVVRLRAITDGKTDDPKNTVLKAGGAGLWWDSGRIKAGAVDRVALTGGEARELPPTADGFHVYWIAVTPEKVSVWVDAMDGPPLLIGESAAPEDKVKISLADDSGHSGMSSFELGPMLANWNGAFEPDMAFLKTKNLLGGAPAAPAPAAPAASAPASVPAAPKATTIAGTPNAGDWQTLLDPKDAVSLDSWKQWVFQDKSLKRVPTEDDPDALRVRSESAAFSCRIQPSGEEGKGYTVLTRLRVLSEGTRTPQDGFLHVGGVRLWWNSQRERARSASVITTDAVGVQVTGGSLIRELPKTTDGFHLYWIAVAPEEVRIWIDRMEGEPFYVLPKTPAAGPVEVVFGDGTGHTGRTSFDFGPLMVNRAGAFPPDGAFLDRLALHAKSDPDAAAKLAWKPWHTDGKIVLGAWGVFGHAYGKWETAKENAYQSFVDAGMLLAQAHTAESLAAGRAHGLQMMVTAQWGGLGRFPHWMELAGQFDNNVALVIDGYVCDRLPNIEALAGRNPVFFDFFNSDAEWPSAGVWFNYRQAGYLAAKHLLDHGCRRPLLICHPIEPAARLNAAGFARHRERQIIDGYSQALDEGGLDATQHIVDPIYPDFDCLKVIMEEVIFKRRLRPDGLVGSSDSLLLHPLKLAFKLGANVLDELRLAGIGNTPWSQENALHPFSSVDLGLEECARRVAEQVCLPAEKRGHIRIEPRLIERE